MTAASEHYLLRVEEAARVLNISRSKAYQLLRAGQIPFVKVGSSYRVPRQALMEWVERNTIPPHGG